jgi:hypothetical protein
VGKPAGGKGKRRFKIIKIVIEISDHISLSYLLSILQAEITYRIIVHILKVYLYLGKADESLTTFVLSKHVKSPLWTTVGWISI